MLGAILALGLAACGGDDEGGAPGNAESAERAFLTGMVHHHETAIEMATIAQERGESQFVSDLSSEIISTQEQEMEQMKSIYSRLFDGELEPDPMAHDGLGLSAEEAGMTHTPETNAALEQANPFDQAFVDEMTPHHEGAVRMAEVILEESDDEEITELAEGIVETQEREVADMNEFREEEYGAPVPDEAGSGGSGDHGGGH
jgi:uncharacterized protein (DUF305 family)